MSALCALSARGARPHRHLARRMPINNSNSPYQARVTRGPSRRHHRLIWSSPPARGRDIARYDIGHVAGRTMHERTVCPSLRGISTVPVDDEDEDRDNGTDGDIVDGGTDAPRAAIPRQKDLEGASAGETDGTSESAKLELLDVMQSSPFEPSSSAEEALDAADVDGESDALVEGLKAAEDVFGSSGGTRPTLADVLQTDTSYQSTPSNHEGRANPSLSDVLRTGAATSSASSESDSAMSGGGETAETKPSLSELLKTDIYAQSWAEPDREDEASSYAGSYTRRSNGGGGDYARRRQLPADTWSSAPSSTLDETPTSWDEDVSASRSLSREPSPTKIEYNKLVERSDALLERLSTDDRSSTLQLMDFDEVMTRWSQFHSEVDAADGAWGSGYGDDDSLWQKASEQCTRLLIALEDNYDRALRHALPSHLSSGEELPMTPHPRLMPNAASYNLALHALAHSGRGERAAPEAAAMLTRMLDRCRRYLEIIDESKGGLASAPLPPPPFEPTIITYNSVLHAIARSGATDAGHLAEEVYATMDDWRKECEERKAQLSDKGKGAAAGPRVPSYKGTLPNARTLACVIDAWAGAATARRQGFSPERAEAILDAAVEKRREYVDSLTGNVRGEESSAVGIREDSGEIDLTADDEGVEEEAVDEELMDDTQQSIDVAEEEPLQQLEAATAAPAPRPNAVAFNTCINAWASSVPSRGREGALRAQDLLSRMEALSESRELDLPPGHACDIVEEDGGSADNDSSLKPNVRTYSMVMNAWSNVARLGAGSGGSAASHCEEMLTKMEERGAVDASIRPNLVSYVTCISAWARAAHLEHAASRAEAVLNRMIDLYYDEDATALPSLDGGAERAGHDAPFNAVITAYARSDDPNAPERALAVLQRLEASPVTPTVTSYNAAMDVCAKHGEPERALEIFERMKERDATSYDTVLNAFARADKEGSAERAYEFLCQLEEERSSGESAFIPSSVSYSTVINAFARASGQRYGGIHTVEKAREIYDKLVQQMKEGVIYGDADPFANACFLNCCANVNGTRSEKKEALLMAITAFEDLKRTPDLLGEPNQYTFGTMMKACVRLSSDVDERHRLMESIFTQACKRGCLSRAILGQFLRHMPSHLNAKVILELGGTTREIPESWHRNVPRKHWPTPAADQGRYY